MVLKAELLLIVEYFQRMLFSTEVKVLNTSSTAATEGKLYMKYMFVLFVMFPELTL